MAKFIAIKPAFYDGKYVEVGSSIAAPEGFKASWAVPAAQAPAPAPVKDDAPKTLAEMGKSGRAFTDVHKGKKPPAHDDIA